MSDKCFASVTTPLMYAPLSPLVLKEISTNLPTITELLSISNIRQSSMNPLHCVFLQILWCYNMRYAELHQCKPNQYLTGDRLIIYGVKNSQSYIIYVPKIYQLVEYSIYAKYDRIFQYVVYESLRQSCIKLGLPTVHMNKSNSARTHYARKVINNSLPDNKPEFTLADVLHHRSTSNERYYE